MQNAPFASSERVEQLTARDGVLLEKPRGSGWGGAAQTPAVI